jgi:nucleoid-associated protein EbfC
MMDMIKMMGKVKEMQERMRQAQSELGTITATGSAGGDLVIATANGHRQIVNLQIDPSLINPSDADMLRDLVIAACNKASDEAAEKAAEHLRQATEGLMPNIPGMDLNSLMNP